MYIYIEILCYDYFAYFSCPLILFGYFGTMLRCWLLLGYFALYFYSWLGPNFWGLHFDPYSHDPTLVVGQKQVWQNYCEPFAGQSKFFSVWDVYFDPPKCQCQNLWFTFFCRSMINTTPKPLGNLLDLFIINHTWSHHIIGDFWRIGFSIRLSPS